MKAWITSLIAGSLLITSTAQAGVVIGGTRLVYDAGKKESSLGINNPDKTPYLIQSWVEMSDNSTEKAPFIITPPLFRLDAGVKNTLRIIHTGKNLPEDKESLFWLNIKSIPSAPRQENTLQLAVKTRMKLIYRPVALKNGSPETQAAQLTWQRQGSNVVVSNPTAYYMNFNKISLAGRDLKDVTYVAPKSTATFALPNGVTAGKVSWQVISDYGAISEAFDAQL